jgi:hypothetical protein
LTVDKQLALLDPGAVFGAPEHVRDSAELTRDEKIDALRRWSYDVAEVAVAVEEGMNGAGRDDLQRRILLALDALGVDLDLEHMGPTKQHGLSVTSRAPNAQHRDSEDDV